MLNTPTEGLSIRNECPYVRSMMSCERKNSDNASEAGFWVSSYSVKQGFGCHHMVFPPWYVVPAS
jgi:hypothetical protein